MLENLKTRTSEQPMEWTTDEQEFSKVIETLIEQWGFKPLLGRVWALLYMRNEPLNPSQIETLLSLSKGNVNALLNELLMWGVIRKVRMTSDRNYYYEVESQIWKSISNVIQARESRILAEAVVHTRLLEQSLSKNKSNPQRDHQLGRITHVREALEIFQTVADMLIKASPERLVSMSKWISRLRGL